MAEEHVNGALEKLNQGIRETKQIVPLRTIELAQEYFGCSIKTLEQQVSESRAALESLLKQVTWGQEEAFQILFQELMDNYPTSERSLNEARKNVAHLHRAQLRKQGELKATDAARREARKRGIDLTDVEGTSSGGRIVVNDVRRAATEAEYQATAKKAPGEPNATNAAKHKAKKLGRDLTEVEGIGYGRLIVTSDVLRHVAEA